MEFSSINFLLYFLPVFFLIYAITPKHFKNAVMIAGSFLFYAIGAKQGIWLLPASILINYGIGICVEKAESAEEGKKKKGKDILYILAVIGNLAVLCHFKLWTEQIPLGLSFYTFQVLSYLTDVHFGEVPAQRKLSEFALYMGMFPKLVSGPITPYTNIKDELKERRFDAARFQDGLKTFVLGLAFKTLLADRIEILWAEVGKTGYESVTWRYAWLGAIAYSLMLYFNFYGYSLMAVGLGRMTGFHLPENFHLPYMSKSVREFYRRWHITMGLWFRKYVYIPLGGNRKGEGRTVLNLLVVWMLTGFWHGISANYFLWGLFLWICIVAERLIEKIPGMKKVKLLPHLWLWFVIPISWMFFAITDVHDLQIYLLRMFGVGNPVNVNPVDYLICIKRHGIMLIIGMLSCTGIIEATFRKWRNKLWMNALLAAVLWLCVWKILGAGSNPFLYLNY
ncbi:MAG: MBOAT family protein [Lachnospiraceae bacterium]|nr:MBOAT family protein [Lachnospiraceae bacterium]